MRITTFSFLSTALFCFTFPSAARDEKCVKWGGQFEVPLRSNNVRYDCTLPDGRPVCCAAVLSNSTYTEDALKQSRGVGYSYNAQRPIKTSVDKSKTRCITKKFYVSSPQEERDLLMSLELEKITSPDLRLDALMKYVTSAEMVANSTRWLQRVSVHMQSEAMAPGNEEDREYLSRFHVTSKCGTSEDSPSEVLEWDEWIEPINIAARHPFAFSRCRHTWQYFKGLKGADRSDVDYVLLQSGMALDKAQPSGKRQRNKHYLLDAGTSTFDSSLSWFTCAYSQRGISFNQVFGWEMTLLDPREYWKKVPARWKAYWHFFNTPISADPSHADSPVRIIKQIAAPGDFVSFKLDIDHPDTEMPVALSLLQDEQLAALVDEFFFELHFRYMLFCLMVALVGELFFALHCRCEVMTSCGWGKSVPQQSHGLLLDRPHVLQFFLELRRKGIRAHIWP